MPTDHHVSSGDCISSIAFNNGFFWETLWNHGSNAELKAKREDPNILMEGDVVHVPDLTLKEETCATDQKHGFILKGVPAKLRLCLTKVKKKDPAKSAEAKAGDESVAEDPPYEPYKPEYEPRANVAYQLEIDGAVTKGSTDGEGYITVPLPPNAREAKIFINRGQPDEEVIPLALGHMDPITTTTGVRKRLKNLGFFCAETGDAITPDLEAALRKFQEAKGLEVSGQIDGATKDKLKQAHGN